jgi:hypothetical protein
MKKNFVSFLLGGFIFLSIGAGTIATVMTIKPSVPKSTVIFYCDNPEETVAKTRQYIKQGYIVKFSNSVVNSFYRETKMETIIILEKY